MVQSVNMLEAQSNLSRLVDAIEKGVEQEIIIARNGRPAARLVPIDAGRPRKRLGIAKGVFELPDSIDRQNDAIADLFAGRTPNR